MQLLCKIPWLPYILFINSEEGSNPKRQENKSDIVDKKFWKVLVQKLQ